MISMALPRLSRAFEIPLSPDFLGHTRWEIALQLGDGVWGNRRFGALHATLL
jgi:hypothetical protein